MPERRAQVLSHLLVLGLFAVPCWAAPPQRPQPPRSGGGETVDVEIKIVPFYAADPQGNPVWDLRSDEVALRVGGKPVFIDTFDAPAAPGGVERTGSNGLRPASRTLVFFFDSAFTSPAGLRSSVLVARSLVEKVSEADRLVLMSHGTVHGLEKKLGPVLADQSGKARFLAALGTLVPEVNRLQTDPMNDLPAITQGKGANDVPSAQFSVPGDSLQESARSEYEGMTRELAASLDLTAVELRHLRGPKLLLVFWQGLDSDLFFTGDVGTNASGTSWISYRRERYGPLVTRFTEPLQAIVDSGTMTVVVNGTAPAARSGDPDPDGPIRQIAQTAGALYASGADPRMVEQRVAAATAAYYEAGFYVKGNPAVTREPVEVVVKRPGVKAWAPPAVKVRETWAALSAAEKRRLVLDLVASGPDGLHGPVRLDLEALGGKVEGRPQEKGGRRLRYAAAWPADLAGKELDVYNVALTPPARGEKLPKVLQFDRQEKARPGAAPLEVALGKSDSAIWGIVAVEPATGKAWYRRLQLKGKGAN